ncbi:hypothetical protein CC80DRAFT_4670 [Byssothecium circinans]|uniref:Uncharacterized protein n=1 Tax=Byssothecium circinans TaxID=147558 RepID=A0A6A5UEQ6_9PLEO|nr:hypothetical protein CC80DRAFT_4670 [Byssothecium circinans]
MTSCPTHVAYGLLNFNISNLITIDVKQCERSTVSPWRRLGEKHQRSRKRDWPLEWQMRVL